MSIKLKDFHTKKAECEECGWKGPLKECEIREDGSISPAILCPKCKEIVDYIDYGYGR